jgi:hypothetical protein
VRHRPNSLDVPVTPERRSASRRLRQRVLLRAAVLAFLVVPAVAHATRAASIQPRSTVSYC